MQVKDLQLKRALRNVLLVLLLSVAGMEKMYAQNNLIVNPDFESGNTGFYSDYIYVSNIVEAGQYAIDNTTTEYGGGLGWPMPSDSHGKFMMINGFGGSNNPNKVVWTPQESIPIVTNTYYTFSCRVVNLNVVVQGQINPAKLQLKINGEPVGNVNQLPSNNDWHNWTVQWYSGTADHADIQIVDMYTSSSGLGDDYALDDMSFMLNAAYSLTANSFTVQFCGDITPIDLSGHYDMTYPSGGNSAPPMEVKIRKGNYDGWQTHINLDHGTATVGSDNRITYTPNANFFGQDSFQYKISRFGLESHATITVNIGDFPSDCTPQGLPANNLLCISDLASFNPSASWTANGSNISSSGWMYKKIGVTDWQESYTFQNWVPQWGGVGEYSIRFFAENSCGMQYSESYNFNIVSEISEENITFADPNVKAICVANWDTNGDGELSYAEAAAVTDLGTVFKSKSNITNFNELQYFTGLIAIGDYAFYDCIKLTSIVIPNSATSIGTFAFGGCTRLTSVEISNSVTFIGSYAFYNCTGLTSIDIPNSVTSIEFIAFWRCTSLTTVTIPSSVTSIDVNPFAGCSGLEQIIVDSGNTAYDSRENSNAIIETGTNVLISGCKNSVIPNSVTTIGTYAFYGCSGFTGSLTIPNSVTSIGWYAFYGCSGFTGSLTIPNSVITIDGGAFSGCSGFTGDLVIPNSVTSIGENAFHSCSSFTGSLTVPNSVTTIGNYAFNGCSGLEQIIVASDNAYYDSRENCNAIIETNTNKLVTGCKNTVIPNSVTTIGYGAFYECSGFTGSLNIPNSVTSIGGSAFYGCSGFTGSLTIPNSVTSIGWNAFYGCSGLTEITMLGITPPSFGLDVFSFTNNCPIYVPYESLNDYKTNWSDYEPRIFPMAYTSIPGYDEGEGNYRFIASPLVENTAPTMVDNMITETPYDLYRFDQSEDAEWQNYKAQTESFVLENGQGYLYANADEVNVIFKGEFNEEETKEVELAYDADAEFAGWNLVGNPFPVSAYANKSYYTMNEDGTAVEPNMVFSATPIPACTGVMVKADDQGESVVFNTTAPETASNQGGLRIALSQVVDRDGPSTGSGALQDKAIISFNAGDRLEKFVFNKNNAKISIPQGGKDLAIACAEKQGEMPLNFKATKNGIYTLSVDVENADVDYLHLIDNLTGVDVDLLQTPDYVFAAKTTDYASRFRLVFSVCGDADGDNGTFAFINNGNIIVTGAEDDAVLQIVDVLGHVIVSTDVARNVSTNGMTPGVYVLRLIQGEKVKTQKMVID